MNVFAYRGFADATLEEIAERAEYGKGTIYSYFQSKEELFEAVVDEGLNRLLELARHSCLQADRGFEACYRTFAREFLTYIFEHSAISALIMREAHQQGKHNALRSRFPELIEALCVPLPPRFILADGAAVESHLIASMFLTVVLSAFQLSLSDSTAMCAVQPPDANSPLPSDTEERIQALMALIDLTFFRGVLSATTEPN